MSLWELVGKNVSYQEAKANRHLVSLTAEPETSASERIAKVASYIPAEILGGYIPLISIVAAAGDRALLWLFFVFLALTPTYVLSVWARKMRSAKLPLSRTSAPWFGLLTGILAFPAWAFSLPDSVLGRIFHAPAWAGLVVVFIVSIVLSILSNFFDDQKTFTTQTTTGGANPTS